MTSIDPSMLAYDPNQMERDALWTPEQAAQARAARAQLEEPLAYRAGRAVKEVSPAIRDLGAAANLGNPFVALPMGAMALGKEAFHQGREFIRGKSGIPSLASEERARADATMNAAAATQSPAATPATPAALPQPQMAYRPAGGGGGTGLGGIAREEAALRSDVKANAKEEDAHISANAAAMADAENNAAAVKADTAVQTAALYNNQIRADDIVNAEQTQREQAARAHIEEQDAKLTAEADENAKLIEDPNRYWHNKSTASKIGSGIAVMLGALGAGLTGGPNLALQGLEKAIDDDIAAQRTNIGQKNRSLAFHQQMQHDRRAAFGDDVNFFNMKKAAAWDDVVRKAQSYDLSNQPAEIQAMSQKNIAEAQAKADSLRAAVKDRTIAQTQQLLGAEAQARNMADNSAQGWAQVATQQMIAGLKSGVGGNLSNEQKQHLSETQAALQMLDNPDAKPGALASFFATKIPFFQNAAKMYDTAREGKAQVVGRGIQHGATTADEQKVWTAQLPESGDSEATAAAKKERLKMLLLQQVSAITGQPVPQQPTATVAQAWR